MQFLKPVGNSTMELRKPIDHVDVEHFYYMIKYLDTPACFFYGTPRRNKAVLLAPLCHSQVLVEKVQQRLVGLLIGSFHFGILQVTPCSHEAMDLVIVPFNLLGHLQVGLVLLDSGFVFVFGWNHEHGDRNIGSVVRVNHGRVACGGCLERRSGLRNQVDNLKIAVVSCNRSL